MEEWKLHLLNVDFLYKVGKEEDLFWDSQNARQKKISDSTNMSLTCIQKIFSVLNHKHRLERNSKTEMSTLYAMTIVIMTTTCLLPPQ